jgi:hypothetical protein
MARKHSVSGFGKKLVKMMAAVLAGARVARKSGTPER